MTPRGGAVDPLVAQCDAALGVVRSVLPPDALLGVYLYGSAVLGGLRRDSDVDLLGVVSRRLTEPEKRSLVAGLVPVSWRGERPAAWRPIEVTLVALGDVRPWRFPPVRSFQYGEWMRDELLAGKELAEIADPDLAVLLTMVRATGVALHGPAPETLLDPVPVADLGRAARASLPGLLDDLEPDTRNVILTLARMWCTVDTGRMVSKDEAATWASERIPPEHRHLLELARSAYLGETEDRWPDLAAVRSLVDVIVGRILGAEPPPDRALPPADASV